MFELLKARDNDQIFDKDFLQVRMGNKVICDIVVDKKSSSQYVFLVQNEGKVIKVFDIAKSVITSVDLRSRMRSLMSGRALYRKVSKPVAKSPLEKGQRYKVSISSGYYGTYKANIIVNDKVNTEVGPQKWNVVICRPPFIGCNEYQHISDLSEIEGIDLTTVEVVQSDDDKSSPKNENDDYILWCPTSHQPPVVIFHTEECAKNIAIRMSNKYNATFYWCKLKGKVEQAMKRSTKVTEI